MSGVGLVSEGLEGQLSDTPEAVLHWGSSHEEFDSIGSLRKPCEGHGWCDGLMVWRGFAKAVS